MGYLSGTRERHGPDGGNARVLSGGGTHAAYQVGALRALAELVPRRASLPLAVRCGTSAGAVNATTLAIHADDFRHGVATLTRWWRRVLSDDAYRTDLESLSRHGMARFAGVLTGLPAPAPAETMNDNASLARQFRDAIEG